MRKYLKKLVEYTFSLLMVMVVIFITLIFVTMILRAILLW